MNIQVWLRGFAAILFSVSANAAVVTENFTGHITFVQDPVGVASQLSSIIQNGQAFSGSFTYDSAWPGIDMTPYCGTPTCSAYQLFGDSQHQAQSLTVSLGGNSFVAGANAGSNGQIGFGSYVISFFGLSGPSAGSLTPSYASFAIDGVTNSTSFVWPSDGFGDLSYSNPRIVFSYYLPGCDVNGSCYFGAIGSFDSLSTAPIPEPSAYLMMLAGLLMLGFVVQPRQGGGKAVA